MVRRNARRNATASNAVSIATSSGNSRSETPLSLRSTKSTPVTSVVYSDKDDEDLEFSEKKRKTFSEKSEISVNARKLKRRKTVEIEIICKPSEKVSDFSNG
jgi:hypothetical protein